MPDITNCSSNAKHHQLQLKCQTSSLVAPMPNIITYNSDVTHHRLQLQFQTHITSCSSKCQTSSIAAEMPDITNCNSIVRHVEILPVHARILCLIKLLGLNLNKHRAVHSEDGIATARSTTATFLEPDRMRSCGFLCSLWNHDGIFSMLRINHSWIGCSFIAQDSWNLFRCFGDMEFNRSDSVVLCTTSLEVSIVRGHQILIPSDFA
jgi:hypothetical protein